MLSSVFGKRKNIQKRLNTFTQRLPAGRAHSPPSPASFASPDVFNPYAGYSESSQPSQPLSQTQDRPNNDPSTSSNGAGTSASKRVSSPRVQLDFGIEESNLSDWFPTDLLQGRADSEPMLRPERNASLGATSNASGSLLGGTLGNSSGSVLANGSSTAAASGSLLRSESRQTVDQSASESKVRDDKHGEGEYNYAEDEVIVIEAARGRDVRVQFSSFVMY